MSPTSREIVRQTIRFQDPPRYARDLPAPWGSDFVWAGPHPNPDARSGASGRHADEWGAVWENIGICSLGEVKEYPLLDWSDWERLKIPDANDPERYRHLPGVRKEAGDRFVTCCGMSLYERVHFLRGLENTWVDIHEEPERLGTLIDLLADMNVAIIGHAAAAGMDALFLLDDWGLQERLMIAPADWRRLWKPRYAKVFGAAKAAGLATFLHSCGYIVDILDDLAEIGLDVIQLDQQENMGLEQLSRWRGKLTFYVPVDIQQTMVRGTDSDIRRYAREMGRCLGTPQGGFIPKWYGDPKGAGHAEAAIRAMGEEFSAMNRERAALHNAEPVW